MSLGETIVAATAGLAGAGVGAWATSRAASVSVRQAEIATARAELAAVYDLIWDENHRERRTRVAGLRYRLIHLEVDPEPLAQLLQSLEQCHRELNTVNRLVDEGTLSEDEAGLSTDLVNATIAAADEVARSLPRAEAGRIARLIHSRRRS